MCLDIFRDYEADYSATLSTEEAELQAQEGGRRWREADEEEADEEEEGRGTLLLVLGMASPFIYPHSAAPLCALSSVHFLSYPSFISSFLLPLNCASMPLKHAKLPASPRCMVRCLFIVIILQFRLFLLPLYGNLMRPVVCHSVQQHKI